MVEKSTWALALVAAGALAQGAAGQGSIQVQLPPGLNILLSQDVLVDGEVGFVTPHDAPVYSVSLTSGMLLDPDGIDLGGSAHTGALFSGDLLVYAVARPTGPVIAVVDVSSPESLSLLGVIDPPVNGGLGGQVISVAPDGRTGFLPMATTYVVNSFDVPTQTVIDPDGTILPGSPGKSVLAGDRLATTESAGDRVFLVDVSNPASLQLAGVVDFPGAYFSSDHQIEVSADGATVFVSPGIWGQIQESTLHAIDVSTGAVLDSLYLPGTTGGLDRHGSTLACGGTTTTYFVDASDPADLRVISQGNYPGAPAGVGSGVGTAFSQDGALYATASIFPPLEVVTLDVQTGQRVGPTLPVATRPTTLATWGADDRLVLSHYDTDEVASVHGLLEPALPKTWCVAKPSSQGCTPRTRVVGLPSASSGQTCIFEAVDVLNQKPALLVYGQAPAFQSFQGGWMCVGSPSTGVRVRDTGGNPPPDDCSGRLAFDFNRRIRSGVDPQLVPGAVVYAQYVYRDPGSVPSLGLTDAAQLVIAP